MAAYTSAGGTGTAGPPARVSGFKPSADMTLANTPTKPLIDGGGGSAIVGSLAARSDSAVGNTGAAAGEMRTSNGVAVTADAESAFTSVELGRPKRTERAFAAVADELGSTRIGSLTRSDEPVDTDRRDRELGVDFAAGPA